MTPRERQSLITAAKAELDRQKAAEQDTMQKIVVLVKKDLGPVNGRHECGWSKCVAAVLAVQAGLRPAVITEALYVSGRRSKMIDYYLRRITEARKALAVLDAVQKQIGQT